MLNAILSLVRHMARPKLLILVAGLAALFRYFMQSTLSKLKTLSGETLIDYQIGYSAQRVTDVFTAYGEEGMALYQRFMLFDLAFPMIYATLFAGSLYLFLSNSKWRHLCLAPILMASADYVENGLFFLLLRSFPDISPEIVGLANLLTLIKYGSA